MMCRISTIDEDWADKGCHVHVGRIEVALRPDHIGGIVCRKVFANTDDWKIDAASKVRTEALGDPKWRHNLSNKINDAMKFLLGVQGKKQAIARGRLRELRMLLIALERWE
jgi:hypothetical protein